MTSNAVSFNMQQLICLDEMASELKKSPRRFRVIVTQKQIPYVRSGRTLLFDREQVIKHLTTTDGEKAQLPKAPKAPTPGRFAKQLGLT